MRARSACVRARGNGFTAELKLVPALKCSPIRDHFPFFRVRCAGGEPHFRARSAARDSIVQDRHWARRETRSNG